jgi:RimJ/RimL family protein N-acetyltransferase
LKDGFSRAGLNEALAHTADGNLRSQAVMARPHMQRNPSRDFTRDDDGVKAWRGLVWVKRRGA